MINDFVQRFRFDMLSQRVTPSVCVEEPVPKSSDTESSHRILPASLNSIERLILPLYQICQTVK